MFRTMQATKDQDNSDAKLRDLEERATTAEALAENAHAEAAGRPHADQAALATAGTGTLIVHYSTSLKT